ncbi:hypothetical protein LJR027_001346 [Terrabacter sp. LjRoot27]|uniref:hypothetical protein n=1 Tax=Terrabacter sp. LjRoot27 TaxID=3342306 RepID=UPI003ECDE58E
MAVVRARYGVDLSDSSHAVELSLRLARGDVPFRDEMNVQVLGAWPAVPFVWAWEHLVGLDGLVLASRVWFVLVCAGVGAVCWRAIVPAFGRGTSACALAVALVPAAYNQQVLSYNTTPALMYLLAVCCALGATVRCVRCARPYAVSAGAATALGAVSHPVTAPAAAALLVVVVVLLWRLDVAPSRSGPSRSGPSGSLPTGRRGGLLGLVSARPGVVAVVAGTLVVGVVVGVLVVAVWGLADISATVAFTDAYQATRPSRWDRLGRWTSQVGTSLAGPWVLLAVPLVLLAAAPAARRLRLPLVLLAVAAVTVQALQSGVVSTTYTVLSWLTPLLGTVLVVVLLPVLVVVAARDRGPVARLAVLGLTPTLVGMPFLAAFTSSGPVWGATGAVLAPGLLAVTVAALVHLATRPAKVALAGLLLASLGTVHALNSFRDGPPSALVVDAPDGAFAGLRTTEQHRAELEANQQAVQACARPGDGALDYIHPAAFLYADLRFDTPIVWMDFFGPTSQGVLDWMHRSGRVPECVVAARDFWPGYGHHRYVDDADPLRDWVVAHYRVVSQTSQLVVLRRAG